jgi:hypothetical protein
MTSPRTRLALGAIALACAGGPLVAAATPAALHVQQVEFIDRHGFERPMTAATMLLPAGWRSEAGVRWNIQTRCHPPQNFVLDAQAPDGAGRIQLTPGEGWGASSMGFPMLDCTRAAFGSAQEYLGAWVQRHRPGARITGYTPRADRQRPPIQSSGPGMVMQRRFDMGRVQIVWNEQGREMHETLAVAMTVADTEMGGAGPTVRSRQGMAYGVLAWRRAGAPVDAATFDTLWDTFRTDARWGQRIAGGNAQMAADTMATGNKIIEIQGQTGRDSINEMARRGEMLRRDREEAADRQIRAGESRDAASDRMQRENVKQIREVENFRGSDGRTVELPGHYPHAWKLKDGSFVLTQDPSFSPQRDLRLEGEKLQRVR